MDAHGCGSCRGAEERDCVSSVGEMEVVMEKGEEAVLSGMTTLKSERLEAVDKDDIARDVGVMTDVNSSVDEGGEGGKETPIDSSSSNDDLVGVGIYKDVGIATASFSFLDELRADGGVDNKGEWEGKGGNGFSGGIFGIDFLLEEDGEESENGMESDDWGWGASDIGVRLREGKEGESGVDDDCSRGVTCIGVEGGWKG